MDTAKFFVTTILCAIKPVIAVLPNRNAFSGYAFHFKTCVRRWDTLTVIVCSTAFKDLFFWLNIFNRYFIGRRNTFITRDDILACDDRPVVRRLSLYNIVNIANRTVFLRNIARCWTSPSTATSPSNKEAQQKAYIPLAHLTPPANAKKVGSVIGDTHKSISKGKATKNQKIFDRKSYFQNMWRHTKSQS
jgi:hypothetical protein